MATTGSKTCSRCYETMPLNQFTPTNNGFLGHCKTCRNKENRERQAKLERKGYKQITEKACNKCRTIKPADRFYKSRSNSDGLMGRCKECHSEYLKEYRNRNKKQSTPKPKSHVKNIDPNTTENNRNYQRNYRRTKYSKDPVFREASLERNRNQSKTPIYRQTKNKRLREKYANDPEYRKQIRIAANHRNTLPSYRLVARVNTQKRREWEIATDDGSINHGSIAELYNRQEGICAYCRIHMDGTYTIDHIIPRTKGGLNILSNVVLCCKSCNSSKGNLDIVEWLLRKEYDVEEFFEWVSTKTIYQ